MPRGPKGERRQADVIGNAVHVMRVLTGEIEGRLLLARGRDTADVAITTTFGPDTLASFRVWTNELTDGQA